MNRPRRHAFSLIELMIAIVILGLGMVMVATMFPIAVSRARSLADATRTPSMENAARIAVSLSSRVDGLEGSSFVGDMIIGRELLGSNEDILVALSDTRVHQLNMENLRIGSNNTGVIRSYVPFRSLPWSGGRLSWHIDPPDFLLVPPGALQTQSDTYCNGFGICKGSFQQPRVRFEDRLFPPQRPREHVSVEGVFDESDIDDQWDEILNGRRYAWAVLHRLREPVGPTRIDQILLSEEELLAAAVAARNKVRELDFYYVALRRPNATQRYAVQNPDTAPNVYHGSYGDGDVVNYAMTSMPDRVPAALPPEEDVILPEPWRVQIQLPETIVPRAESTGIPTEVLVPPPALVQGSGGASPAAVIMLADMFQAGTRFVDEVNGQVYKVVRERLTPLGQNSGAQLGKTLTLDREITLEDIEDQLPQDPAFPCAGCEANLIDSQELLRTVWVFPLPVQVDRPGNGVVIYDGPQPVINIRVRSATLSP